jgi:hypothetical protein
MKPVWRIAIWIGSALLVVIVGLGSLAYAGFHKFYPTPPQAHFPPPRSLAEAQHQDLEFFRNYLDYNRTYTDAARAEVLRLLSHYEAEAGKLTSAQFELAIARMAALADNGHSKAFPGGFRLRHDKLPCLLYRFDDGYYIVRARPACQALLGAKLLAIDGHSTAEIADRLFEYARGQRNHYDQYVTPFYLESPQMLHAAGLAAAPDRVTLHVLLQDGTEQDVPMSADPPDPKWDPWVSSDRYLSSEPIPSEGPDWKPFLPADAKLPLFIADYSNPFHTMSWPGIYYASFRSNESEPGHPIEPFVDAIAKEISAQKPRMVIIDERLNQGGNFTKTGGLMSRITTLAPSIERVYILTSAWTFSAAETSVALAKEHGGSKVTLVGELLGDRLVLWGEGGSMELPNSGIRLRYATGLHDYTRPCWGETGCFWVTLFYPMHVRSLAPDVKIPYTFADYRALRDPVLEFVLHGRKE